VTKRQTLRGGAVVEAVEKPVGTDPVRRCAIARPDPRARHPRKGALGSLRRAWQRRGSMRSLPTGFALSPMNADLLPDRIEEGDRPDLLPFAGQEEAPVIIGEYDAGCRKALDSFGATMAR
jgi:hypothetical protein